jgi:CheY-like chemotaxis protein
MVARFGLNWLPLRVDTGIRMILLVEDDDDDVFLMEFAMSKISDKPPMLRVSNGQEALDYLKGLDKYADRTVYPLPEIIFLDLKLPFVHGFEVLKWIKSQPALQDIHVTVITGSLEDVDREVALRLGANAFHSKPPETEFLRRVFTSMRDKSK